MFSDRYTGRDIGRLSSLYSFCDKYHLSKDYGENIEDLIQDALVTLTLQNEFRRPANGDKYFKIQVTYDKDVITIGYFTSEEIEDIKLFPHVKVEIL